MVIIKIFQGKNGQVEFGIYKTEKDIDEINEYIQKVINIEVFKKVFKLEKMSEDEYVTDFKKKEEVEMFSNDGTVGNLQEQAKSIKKRLIDRQQYERFHALGV